MFIEHDVVTVQEIGLSGTKNGALLAAIDGKFDVFITADKNLRYQQNLTGRKITIIELPTNRWPVLKTLFDQITEVLETTPQANYGIVDLP